MSQSNQKGWEGAIGRKCYEQIDAAKAFIRRLLPDCKEKAEPAVFDQDAWSAMHERVQRDYADYLALLGQEAKKQNVCGPHCDAYVLHKPGDCQYCDGFPALQAFRKEHRIAFTDDLHQDNERPCPATVLRPTETIHRWHGNRPYHEDA